MVGGPPLAEVLVLDAQFTDQSGQPGVVGVLRRLHAQLCDRGPGDAFPVGVQSAHRRVGEENPHVIAVLLRATGRRPGSVLRTLGGEQDKLLVTALDITSADAARAAVEAAVARFGRIDVLINNAATFQAGCFEEISEAQMRAQIETNLFGPMNITRAALPVMRARRSGHIVTISSIAGLVGQEFCVAYAASKFGVEGWMESLRHDVEPYGITTTIVEPGFFRTELLVDASTSWAELAIDDYAECPRP